MITTNIHGVKAIRMARIDFGGFVSHKFLFETESGLVEISGFALESLEVEMLPMRHAHQEATESEEAS